MVCGTVLRGVLSLPVVRLLLGTYLASVANSSGLLAMLVFLVLEDHVLVFTAPFFWLTHARSKCLACLNDDSRGDASSIVVDIRCSLPSLQVGLTGLRHVAA